MVDVGGEDVFLLLPWVLLEGRALADSCGVVGIDLPAIGVCWNGYEQKEEESSLKLCYLLEAGHPQKAQCLNRF